MKKHLRAFVRKELIEAGDLAPVECEATGEALTFEETKALHFACLQLGEDDEGFNVALVHPVTGLLYKALSIDLDFEDSETLEGKSAEQAREIAHA